MSEASGTPTAHPHGALHQHSSIRQSQLNSNQWKEAEAKREKGGKKEERTNPRGKKARLSQAHQTKKSENVAKSH
jgi:hypothetical protein